MSHEATVQAVLTALDAQRETLSPWEHGFLLSLRTQTSPLTLRQQDVLVTLANAYCDPLLAAELRGQMRLFV